MSTITLTIDNGPHATITPALLAVLERHAVPAMFFVVGTQVERPGGADLLRRIAGAGHTIGNHTYAHAVPFGDNPDPDAVDSEVVRNRMLLEDIIGPCRLFRPFGGGGRLDTCLFSPALVEHLQAERYTCVLWNAVPRDWEQPGTWVETALQQVDGLNHAVLVVHDIVAGNDTQVERFIHAACAAGHTFCAEPAETCVPIRDGQLVGSLDGLVRSQPGTTHVEPSADPSVLHRYRGGNI